MKKTILLFALLCGAMIAAEPDVLITSGAITIAAASEQHGKIIVLPNATGDWIPVTLQEAADVVKAMEILKRIAGLIQYSGSTSTITLDAVGHLSPWQETPDELRARANQIEAEQKAVEQNRKDVLWAESILELWKKKLEEAK